MGKASESQGGFHGPISAMSGSPGSGAHSLPGDSSEALVLSVLRALGNRCQEAGPGGTLPWESEVRCSFLGGSLLKIL